MEHTIKRSFHAVPLFLVIAVQLGAWSMLLSGGMVGVRGWILLLTLVPFVGVLTLLGTLVRLAWKRQFRCTTAALLAFSLLALWPGAWSFGALQIRYPASLDEMKPAATVRLPADVPLVVAWGGDALATNYHAFTPDQRWAYDLVVEPAFHGSKRLEDYGCWGIPVLAPARARVHHTHDGEEDVAPGVVSGRKPTGNFVSLELEGGTFLVLAHLQKGSVQVQPGQQVEEGTVLGRCGNSGRTSEPHIHVHHQKQDPAVSKGSFAEGLPLFFRDHDGPAMPVGGLRTEGERIIPTGDRVQHRGGSDGAAELPAP